MKRSLLELSLFFLYIYDQDIVTTFDFYNFVYPTV